MLRRHGIPNALFDLSTKKLLAARNSTPVAHDNQSEMNKGCICAWVFSAPEADWLLPIGNFCGRLPKTLPDKRWKHEARRTSSSPRRPPG